MTIGREGDRPCCSSLAICVAGVGRCIGRPIHSDGAIGGCEGDTARWVRGGAAEDLVIDTGIDVYGAVAGVERDITRADRVCAAPP